MANFLGRGKKRNKRAIRPGEKFNLNIHKDRRKKQIGIPLTERRKTGAPVRHTYVVKKTKK